MTVNQPETDNTTEVSGGAQQVSGDTPGTLIRRAREEAGLTRDELSERMCFIGDKLSLLENDDYDRLPAALYVKGYIRNIAKELKIDEAPILKAYAGYYGEEEESRAILDHVQRDSLSEGGGRSRLPGLAVLPLIAVAGVFWWMNGRDFTPPAMMSGGMSSSAAETAAVVAPADDTAAETADMDPVADVQSTAGAAVGGEESAGKPGTGAEAAADMTAVDEPVLEAGEAMGGAVDEAAPAVVEGDAGPSGLAAGPDPRTAESQAGEMPEPTAEPVREEVADATPAPASVGGPAAETAPTPAARAAETAAVEAAAAQARLQLKFAEEAWIEVKDGSGSVLMAKLQPAGADVDLRGEPPFRLMLGNAAATEVRFQGELVNSDPLGNRRTRRITVGE